MPTLLQSILESAQRCGAAFASTCSDNGTTTSLIDATLLDQAADATAFNGGWIYRPDAVLTADKTRRIADEGFNPQSGALVPNRAWTNPPTIGETYHVYAMVPPKPQAGLPTDWTTLVNRGLNNMWFIDELTVGHGVDGLLERRFPIDRIEIVLVAAIAVAGGSGATITAPSGWTSVTTINQSTNLQLRIFTHRQLNTDPIEWTFTLDSSRAASAVLGAYVNCNPTTPVDVTGNATGASAQTITAPAVTTAQNNEVVLRFAAGATAAAFTPPTDMYLRADVVGLDGAATIGLQLTDNVVGVAGSSAAVTFTPSTVPNNMIAATVALAIRNARTQTVFTSYSYGQNGTGASTIVLQRPPDLPSTEWVPNRQALRQVLYRRYPAGYTSDYQGQAIDVDMNKGGRTADILENGPQRTLTLSQGPASQQDVVLVVQRPYPPLTLDIDTTDCPLDIVALRTRVELFAYLNSAPQTQHDYDYEIVAAQAEWLDRWKLIRPAPAMVGIG